MSAIVSPTFKQRMLAGFGLLTVKVLFYHPQTPSILQEFTFQTEDVAPDFPRLSKFLSYWRNELAHAPIHTVTIAHSKLLRPAEVSFATYDDKLRLH